MATPTMEKTVLGRYSCMHDVPHATLERTTARAVQRHRPSTLHVLHIGRCCINPLHYLNEHNSAIIIPKSVKFCILITNWHLYKYVKLRIKRAIIVEVIRKTKVVSLICGHGVILSIIYLSYA